MFEMQPYVLVPMNKVLAPEGALAVMMNEEETTGIYMACYKHGEELQ